MIQLSARRSSWALVLASAFAAAACSNVSSKPLSAEVNEPLPYEATLSFPDATASQVYRLPSQGAGPVTVYDIPVGTLVQRYAHTYLDTFFAGGREIGVDISVEEFRVRDYRTFLGAKFQVRREDQTVFEESYSAFGRRYVEEEDWSGAFERREAVNRTTDDAMRSIFAQFIRDARGKHEAW